MAMGRFDGKVALVTGSTQGLGEAISDRLVAEGLSGLVVTGRNTERGAAVAQRLNDRGCRTVFEPADLGVPAAAGNLIEVTDREFGKIDILVNSAGDSHRGTLEDTSVDLFNHLVAVNLRAPFLLMQGAIAMMRREGIEGSILNIASVASHGGPPYLTVYATTKGALVTLTKNVANSVLWDRIRVNALNIGWMDSPGEHSIRTRFHGGDEDWLPKAEASQPFGRLLKLPEVARAVSFLVSEESGMMTGSAVDFNQMVIGCVAVEHPSAED
ncbi:MAG: SDR family oxidoreductase [Acidimicrobiia bacterium]|nr:SDR family oxidoreductase [Acidimicrobiia bacterium]